MLNGIDWSGESQEPQFLKHLPIEKLFSWNARVKFERNFEYNIAIIDWNIFVVSTVLSVYVCSWECDKTLSVYSTLFRRMFFNENAIKQKAQVLKHLQWLVFSWDTRFYQPLHYVFKMEHTVWNCQIGMILIWKWIPSCVF